MAGLTNAVWVKSSFSGDAKQNCVEVARLAAGAVAVRHSKDPAGPMLTFSADEWRAFVQGLAAGEFGVTT
jgi:hypothetical protein